MFISVHKTIFYMYMLIKEYFVLTIYDSQKRRKNILANEYITVSELHVTFFISFKVRFLRFETYDHALPIYLIRL